jgi:hypothetical protein
MATIPQVEQKRRTDEELAAELLELIDGYFDDIGLSQAEKDARYDALDEPASAGSSVRAKAGSSFCT